MAYIVFEKFTGLEAALKLDPVEPLILCSETHRVLTGIKSKLYYITLQQYLRCCRPYHVTPRTIWVREICHNNSQTHHVYFLKILRKTESDCSLYSIDNTLIIFINYFFKVKIMRNNSNYLLKP